jgi:3-oxochol-4-en-24-oyl-CoA dehydrogenase
VLTVAESIGAMDHDLDLAVQYAKDRTAFGRPIGSFQAIKHLLADTSLMLEMSKGMAAAAARAVGAHQDDAAEVASMAKAFVGDCGIELAQNCFQVFGGIGYTWEHDVHLYWRRAICLASLLGPASAWEERLGELGATTTRTRDLRLDTEPAGVRAQVADQLAAVKAAPEGERRRMLAKAGLVSPHFPRPYGLLAGAAAQVIISQEFERVGMSQPSTLIGEWALPTILAHGTDAQRERFVLPTLRGDVIWCQLFSEPGAGSDLASLRTKADRRNGSWFLNGQKVWTSSAQDAHWAICLARTDPQARKHEGISYFLVDMRSPGVTVRPLREANGGHLFNEVFLDNVAVPDDLMVGAPGDGWRLARTTLGNERVSIGSGMSGPAEPPAHLARRLGVCGPAVTRDVGRLTAWLNAAEALARRGLLQRLGGTQPGAESSVLKLMSSQVKADVQRTALAWAGPAAAGDGVSGAAQAYLSVPPTLIGGGTSEIQLNVIAEHVLGLPRG